MHPPVDTRPVRYRWDVMIGGPMHRKPYVVEKRQSTILFPTSLGYGLRYSDEVYRIREFAFKRPDGEVEVVEFYAHDQLTEDQACGYVWDEIMRAMGARLIR